jgi:hypothetical protein
MATKTTTHDSSPTERLFLRLLVVVTLLHCAVLAFRIPVFSRLPGWFWWYTDKPWGDLFSWSLIVLSLLMVLTLIRMNTRHHLAVLVMFVVAGYTLQHGFALLEGRGINGIRDRMITTGHAEFAHTAVKQQDIWSTLTHYEDLLRDEKLTAFAQSKPPGQLLLYMATERLANAKASAEPEAKRFDRLTTFASYLWPLITYLAIFPLFWIGRMFTNEQVAIRTCALYLFVPSVTLVTLHTDQVFFPLFGLLVFLVGIHAIRRQSWAYGVLLGVVFYIALFFTFGLLLFVPLITLIGLLYGWQQKILKRILVLLVMALIGVVAAHFLFRLILNYDIVTRYQSAITHHVAWKGWKTGTAYTIMVVNLIEFATWLGMPVALSCLAGLLSSATEMKSERRSWSDFLAVSLAVAVLCMDVLGRTRGEIARLWLFVVPFMCLIAVSHVYRLFKPAKANLVFVMIVFLETATTYLTKVRQDFW